MLRKTYLADVFSGPRPNMRSMRRKGSKDDSHVSLESELQRSVSQRVTTQPEVKQDTEMKSTMDRLNIDITPGARRRLVLQDLSVATVAGQFLSEIHAHKPYRTTRAEKQQPAPAPESGLQSPPPDFRPVPDSKTWTNTQVTESPSEDKAMRISIMPSPHLMDTSPTDMDVWFSRGMDQEKSGDDASAVRMYQHGADNGHVRCLHVSKGAVLQHFLYFDYSA